MIRKGSEIHLLSWDEISIITKVNFERRLSQTMPGILAALLLIFFYSKKKGQAASESILLPVLSGSFNSYIFSHENSFLIETYYRKNRMII